MGSLPTLPPSLEAHIDQTVIHTYRQAFDAFSSLENLNSSADISRRTAKAILLRVHATIRSAQREQNGRLSLQNRLPPDVWCNVWQHLSFADRIAVTHVCSAWRATAVNAPALWNHIEFYTTRHCPHCWCTECEDPADYFEPGHAPEWEEGAYPKNATNITAADILLSRSRALDLSVTVFITPLEVREEDLTTLAHSLSGIHLNRLRSLVLYTADFTAPRLFLRGFPALPMLNCLSIQNLPVPSGQIELPGTPHHHTCVPENLPLPVLDSLRFASRFSLPADHSYLTVRSLALEPTRDAEWELFQAIEACPNVERLTLDLGVTAEEADSEYDASWWDGRKPTSLRAATIASVPASCESWIRGVFAPTLPSLALGYAHTRELNTGGGILCDLKSDIHLRHIPTHATDMKTKAKVAALQTSARRRRPSFSFLTVHNPFSKMSKAAVQTPKRKVALRSWLERVADCSPVLQSVGDDGNVFVTTLDGLPHPVGSHSQLRRLTAEQMEEVVVAINSRLPASLSVSFRAGDRQSLLAVLENLLGFPQSETPKAPRRTSISMATPPRSPLSPLVNGKDAMSPFQIVGDPSSPICHSSPTRLAATRTLQGITALLTPPSAGIPSSLLNGHAEHLRSLERDPPTPTKCTYESPVLTPTSRKRMLEPVEEDVDAEEEVQEVRGKRRRTVSPTGLSPKKEDSPVLRRTKTTGSMANGERRVTRAQAARLATENMRVTRSMSANLPTTARQDSPRQPPPRPERSALRRSSIASTSSQPVQTSPGGAALMPPSTSFELHAEIDELDPTSPVELSPAKMGEADSVATLRALASAGPVQADPIPLQTMTSSPGNEAAAEIEYEASCSECDSDAGSVSVHTDTTTDASSESATPSSARAATEESATSVTTGSAVYDGDDEDVFNAPSDEDSFARLKSASIWFRSPDSQFSSAASEAPSSPCARFASRHAESTPRGAQASTWMFVTQTGPARGDGKARRRVDVSPIRISNVPAGSVLSPTPSQLLLPRPTTSDRRTSAGSKLFLERTPRTTVATAQRGRVTRSAFVDTPAKSEADAPRTQSAFSPPPAKRASSVSRARSLILPSSPLGTATASPLARSAVGNALRTRCRSVSRPLSEAEMSTPSSRASDWRTPTASPTPKARGRSRQPKA